MGLRYDEIGEILKIIDSSSCDEFVLETAEIKLVVRRHGANGASPAPVADPATFQPPSTPVSTSPASSPIVSAATGTASPARHETHHVVRAPMVGTFFRSPSPEASPFVEVGSKVKAGDPLCMIEVMKLFTTISAELTGIIVEIGAEDAQPVEYGQMLFVIEPS